MSWRERFKRFRERYSAENLLTLLIGLVQNLMDSVLGSGNIFLQILILPILVLLLILVRLLRGLKWLISNSFELLVDAVNFVISLIARYFSEISFYWRLLATVSVWTNLVFRYLIGKMLEALNFQLQQLVNDQATLTTKYTKGYGEISLELTKRLLLWLWTLVLAIVMSVGVLVLVLLPVSVFVRKRYEQAQFYQEDFYTQFYSQSIPSLAEEALSPSEGQRSTPKRYVSTVIFLVLISSTVGGHYVYSWYYPSATYLSEQGNVKFNEGKYAEALQFYNKALTVKPDYQEVLAKRKEASEKLGMQIFQDKLKDGSLGPKMVKIPAGKFQMGDIQGTGNSDEKPVHWVEIAKPFAIGQYEVTRGEFRQFVQATGYKTEAETSGGCYGWTGKAWEQKAEFTWRDVGSPQEDTHPVICVSWNDVVAYVGWLSQQTGYTYRLPTEAEWEYAARAGTKTDYWQGNTTSHEYANYGKDQCCEGLAQGKDQWVFTAPVGSFESNPFSLLYDTAGNVWEWTCSAYTDTYGAGEEQRCVDKNDNRARVFRGGSWYTNPSRLRVAYRNRYTRAFRSNYVGMRFVRIL